MRKPVIRGLLGVVVGLAVYYRFGGEVTWNAILAFVTSTAGAVAVFRGRPRWMQLAVGVAAALGAVQWSLWTHDELRGERPDTGPDPTQPIADSRVASLTDAWILPTDDGSLRVRATGLSPRVEPMPAGKGATIDWRNAPPQIPSIGVPTSRPWRFAVWADCRGGPGAFEEVREGIRDAHVAFSVGVGDLVGMARVYQFEILSMQMGATGAPAFFVPGNHDLDPFDTLRPYARVLGPSRWSFVADHILFIGLDSARHRLTDDDATWAEALVHGRGADVPRVVTFCHNPIYPPAGHPTKTLPQDEAPTKRIQALVQEAKAWCFSGDFHGYDRNTIGNVTQIISGGAGGKSEYEGPHHWILATVGPDGLSAERMDVIAPKDVSQRLDRLRVLRDDTAWTSHGMPLRFIVGWLLSVFGLGGLVGAAFRRRQAPIAPS
jgi:hypothetical protein